MVCMDLGPTCELLIVNLILSNVQSCKKILSCRFNYCTEQIKIKSKTESKELFFDRCIERNDHNKHDALEHSVTLLFLLVIL